MVGGKNKKSYGKSPKKFVITCYRLKYCKKFFLFGMGVQS